MSKQWTRQVFDSLGFLAVVSADEMVENADTFDGSSLESLGGEPIVALTSAVAILVTS